MTSSASTPGAVSEQWDGAGGVAISGGSTSSGVVGRDGEGKHVESERGRIDKVPWRVKLDKATAAAERGENISVSTTDSVACGRPVVRCASGVPNAMLDMVISTIPLR